MEFCAPHMSYRPRLLEGWERIIAFTVLARPLEELCPAIAGVVRHREGPLSETPGERRSPPMVHAVACAVANTGGAGPLEGGLGGFGMGARGVLERHHAA